MLGAASAPVSVDRAAADHIGERHPGQKGKESRSQAPQNPEALTWSFWSGCPDLNRGPLRPERSALTKLRHSPPAPQREADQSP
jgi:hypothetical protein